MSANSSKFYTFPTQLNCLLGSLIFNILWKWHQYMQERYTLKHGRISCKLKPHKTTLSYAIHIISKVYKWTEASHEQPHQHARFLRWESMLLVPQAWVDDESPEKMPLRPSCLKLVWAYGVSESYLKSLENWTGSNRLGGSLYNHKWVYIYIYIQNS